MVSRIVIRIEQGPAPGRQMVLSEGQSLTVGRTEHAEWAVPQDHHLSRLHFQFEVTQGRCWVRDLGSTNGTSVNGAEITECELRDGDQVVAGKSVFSVRADSLSVPSIANPRPARTTGATAESGVAASVPLRSSQTRSPTSSELESLGIDEESQLDASPPASSSGRRGAKSGVGQSVTLVGHEQSGRQPAPSTRWHEEVPGARAAMLFAAAWKGESWLLAQCRRDLDANVGDLAAASLVGILGDASDLDRMRSILDASELGDARFDIIASYGSPLLIDSLLERIAMEEDDDLSAISAEGALEYITGLTMVWEDDGAPETPDQEDAGRETEKANDGVPANSHDGRAIVHRVDRDAYLAEWRGLLSQDTSAARWAQGCPINGDLDRFRDQLTTRALWEAALRAAHRHDTLPMAMKDMRGSLWERIVLPAWLV